MARKVAALARQSLTVMEVTLLLLLLLLHIEKQPNNNMQLQV